MKRVPPRRRKPRRQGPAVSNFARRCSTRSCHYIGMMMSTDRPLPNRVQQARLGRGWSQDQLADKSGISRSAVSAIETHRLVPSVASALALADCLGRKVEDLFGVGVDQAIEELWAWPPTREPCRFWRASIDGRVRRFPAEMTVAGVLPHDGVCDRGAIRPAGDVSPEKTLVMASCDPAAGLLAREYERVTGFRLLPLHRSSREALDLLRRG